MFGMVLGRTMKIDPEARSSMWEDLQRGRRTEIDYLQGVITEIADRHGSAGPTVASRRRADQAGGSGGRGVAGINAGADPAVADACLEMATIGGEFAQALCWLE